MSLNWVKDYTFWQLIIQSVASAVMGAVCYMWGYWNGTRPKK